MRRNVLIRNVRAGEQLDLFLVSAVSSLLLVRFYLYLTGYPQVGGATLHIAHMLWGGALMLVSMVLFASYLGFRIQRAAALLGGIGFGVFIDEIGKFITKDNDYFFRPTIGIIYAIFVVLYLLFSFLTRRQRLTSQEYQLNALAQLEEAALMDMDPAEKSQVAALLGQADPKSQLTKQLRVLLERVETTATDKTGALQRISTTVDRTYARLWEVRSSNMVVQVFFVAEAALFAIGMIAALYTNFDSVQDFFSGQADYGRSLVIGQFVSTIVASILAGIGILRISVSRLEAFIFFRYAALVNLFLTEFFIFSRIQFGAMASFIFNLVVLLLVSFVVRQEQRHSD